MKMEKVWTDERLEIVGYRETGTGILKGVDDINAILDEQVRKKNAFRATQCIFFERTQVFKEIVGS